jgi:hypothetical protein
LSLTSPEIRKRSASVANLLYGSVSRGELEHRVCSRKTSHSVDHSTKYNGWAYEKERRLIQLEKANQPLSFRPAALRAIVISCSMLDEILKSLRRLLAERALNLFPKIHLYRCEMHESEYKLSIRNRERAKS